MKRNATVQSETLLTEGLSAPWQRVGRRQIAAILAFLHNSGRLLPENDTDALCRVLLQTLLDWIEVQRRDIARLHANHHEFTTRLANAGSDDEIRGHVLDYARTLGAGRRQLLGDRRAFGRWFGPDAVSERYQKQFADCERHLSFSLERLGELGARYIGGDTVTPEEGIQRWRQLDLETGIGELLAYEGDLRVRLAAFHALARVARALPPEGQGHYLGDSTLAYSYRLAMDHRQPVWLQTEALSLLSVLSYPAVVDIIERRLTRRTEGDDFFVRQHAVQVLGDHADDPRIESLLETALDDPSATVRQALIDLLVRLRPASIRHHLPVLALEDSAREVRGYAVHALIRLVETDASFVGFTQELTERGARHERQPVTLRLYCHIIPAIAAILLEKGEEELLEQWSQSGFAVLTALHSEADDLRVRRWSAQARETLWCIADPEARSLHQQLRARLGKAPVGKRRSLEVPAQVDDDRLGRVLSALTQDDFGLDASRSAHKLRFRRWERFRFRLWRAWYEFTHSSPDKRQAGHHTIGRVYYGLLQVPSARMSELSPTKVPGEPLHMSDEDGWRPYLPLVDQAISSLDQSWPTRPMKIYSSEGVTEITPPSGLVARLRARLKLTFRFAHYARLRNWESDSGGAPDRYMSALQALGFQVGFRTYTDPASGPLPADPAVRRFFPALAFPPLLVDWWQQYTDYFVSVYQNTLRQLGFFLAGMLALFVGRHVYVNLTTRRARNRLPLVIGGWGTRGKSGTERLKAALFNGLGFHVISKTTGCEAMFLHGYSHRDLQEMFLFRPYDKATIWEQADLVKLSRKLDADVFLWECMGLTPSYVRILQKQWMRDDISTITNTYPDHEDIQGPAGINIPIVMTEFIPKNSTLITSEAEMLPILQQASRQLGTECHSVSWIESELLPGDTLSRFPYEEHPTNIALVLRMADEFDIPHLFALKAMADHVILDLGVLKVYPMAHARGRWLQFTNGMSANERLGALGNWNRLGFDRQDPEAEPGVWVSTVINNRADRVARSRVFADILVNDISADRHFLIGTNLEGLMGYIEESWQVRREETTLWPQSQDNPDPSLEWHRLARQMRVCVTEKAVLGRLSAMLEGLGVAYDTQILAENLAAPANYLETLVRTHEYTNGQEHEHEGKKALLSHHLETVLGHHQSHYREWQEFSELDRRVARDQAPSEAINEQARDLLWKWFRSRIEIVRSPFVTGEQLVNLICDQTPPGYTNRILGMQNIKGPGLDWVYRWQAWDKIHAAGGMILSGNRGEATRGLQFLASFQEYGLLSAEYMQDLLHRAKELPVAQSESFQAELRLIAANLEGRNRPEEEGRSPSEPSGGLWLTLVTWVEQFLDVGDAVRRRRKADRIYRDMVTRRISTARAADELQYLTKRQKGGWLVNR
ncbi:poly-gamma-glutamate synthase PgsB/CapB [Marinobacter daqiaonensis]|uniref:Poly-gamma-glutamate synthase PgsB/CapB n=1 Tax=Marinobacter daqiaonensis TaxID=650891 RepID=A0A1I6H823_9GAMM|nr:HEAT repeat domain-containing protein [Marinobacter daqiaonensis]SFR50464.1 poly-gamma-glutamate synthase PgsB/CapB [Marinobacter daqiaonensis]